MSSISGKSVSRPFTFHHQSVIKISTKLFAGRPIKKAGVRVSDGHWRKKRSDRYKTLQKKVI